MLDTIDTSISETILIRLFFNLTEGTRGTASQAESDWIFLNMDWIVYFSERETVGAVPLKTSGN